MPTSSGSSIISTPSKSSSGSSSQSSTTTSESGPYAPQFMNDAAGAIQDFTNSAKSSATAQTGRLMDFIKNLYSLRLQVMNQAKGAAARGAAGQQNPLAVYQAVNEMANQAGIPLTAQISQTLLQGNNIENTLNQMLSQAATHYTQLASIPHTQTNSNASGSGQVLSLGGGNKQKGGVTQPGYSRMMDDGKGFGDAIKDTDKVRMDRIDAETAKNNATFAERARNSTIKKADKDIGDFSSQNQNVQWNNPSAQPGFSFTGGSPESFGGQDYSTGGKFNSSPLTWNPPASLNFDFGNSSHVNYANEWLDMINQGQNRFNGETNLNVGGGGTPAPAEQEPGNSLSFWDQAPGLDQGGYVDASNPSDFGMFEDPQISTQNAFGQDLSQFGENYEPYGFN